MGGIDNLAFFDDLEFFVFYPLLTAIYTFVYGFRDFKASEYLGKGLFLTWVEEPIENPITFIKWLLDSYEFEGKWTVVPWWLFFNYLWLGIFLILLAGFNAFQIFVFQTSELITYRLNLISLILSYSLFAAAILKVEAKAWRGEYEWDGFCSVFIHQEGWLTKKTLRYFKFGYQQRLK